MFLNHFNFPSPPSTVTPRSNRYGESFPLAMKDAGSVDFSLKLCYTVKKGFVVGENVRASREKSGNHRLANLPTCYYKFVYVILCIQSCPILRGINILCSTFGDPADQHHHHTCSPLFLLILWQENWVAWHSIISTGQTPRSHCV